MRNFSRHLQPYVWTSIMAMAMTDSELACEKYTSQDDSEEMDALCAEEDRRNAIEPKFYYVNLYQVDRAFGGPEEGGWYYDCGEFQECIGVTENYDAASAMFAETDKDLKGQRGLGGLLVRIEEHAGHDYPQHRPYYS